MTKQSGIIVCVAPILDPRLPSVRLKVGEDGCSLGTDNSAPCLGPFDEAALELALKLRDRNPDTNLSVIVLGGEDCADAIRAIFAFRIDDVSLLPCVGLGAWDVHVIACRICESIRQREAEPGLVLLGREVGDRDDGVLPPLLAARLGRPFVGHCHAVRAEPDRFSLLRMRNDREEEHAVAPPCVASVTNHAANRLRYPLMKDVMAARTKKARRLADTPAVDGVVSTARLTIVSHDRAGQPCRMLGGTSAAQATELARFLAPWRPAR